MDNTVRQTLKNLLLKHGANLCNDKYKCEAMLKAACPDKHFEIDLLITALSVNIPIELIRASKDIPQAITLMKLSNRLERNLGVKKEHAEWSVESWAIALGMQMVMEQESSVVTPSIVYDFETQTEGHDLEPISHANSINWFILFVIPIFAITAYAAGINVNMSWIIAVIFAAIAGKHMGWAIRAWPGHEEFHCDYLYCADCEGGKRRGCYNAGNTQDKLYVSFSALVAGGAFAHWGATVIAVLFWLFSIISLIIIVINTRYLIIPDIITVHSCWIGLLYSCVCWLLIWLGFERPSYYIEINDSFWGFIIGGGIPWFVAALSISLLGKEGLGGGDVKLLAGLGAWSGYKTILATMAISFCYGAIGGIMIILYKKTINGNKYEPLTTMTPTVFYHCASFLSSLLWLKY